MSFCERQDGNDPDNEIEMIVVNAGSNVQDQRTKLNYLVTSQNWQNTYKQIN